MKAEQARAVETQAPAAALNQAHAVNAASVETQVAGKPFDESAARVKAELARQGSK